MWFPGKECGIFVVEAGIDVDKQGCRYAEDCVDVFHRNMECNYSGLRLNMLFLG